MTAIVDDLSPEIRHAAVRAAAKATPYPWLHVAFMRTEDGRHEALFQLADGRWACVFRSHDFLALYEAVSASTQGVTLSTTFDRLAHQAGAVIVGDEVLS